MTPRAATVGELFTRLRGCRVAVIGIGGGGDVYSALPLFFELERRYGATVYPGGLTWKRAAHDPQARPRRLDEFRSLRRVNEIVGLAAPDTVTHDGICHAEAHLSAALGGRDVLMIDPGKGSRAVCSGLDDLTKQLSLDMVIGLDVGGDALASGEEPTLESPLCDQTMIWALAERDEAVAIASMGTDGEMLARDLARRLKNIDVHEGYLGAFAPNIDELSELEFLVATAPTESSKFVPSILRRMNPEQLSDLASAWNVAHPDFEKLLSDCREMPLRNGSRTGFTCDATALYVFCDAQTVRRTAALAEWWNPDQTILAMAEELKARGIKTELT